MDYAAPSGPPPPRVPDGWKAVWNQQYQEWFYVNIYTKQSTWEKPTTPALRPGEEEDAHATAPPGYSTGPNDPVVTGDKKQNLQSNNPYSHGGESRLSHETDEELARRLQAEEDARNHKAGVGANSRGSSDAYYGGTSSNQYGASNISQANPPGIQGGYAGAPQAPAPYGTAGQPASKSGGFLGKLLSKAAAAKGQSSGGYPASQGYGHGGYPSQQPHGYGGGFLQQGGHGGYGGGYPQQGYGNPMMMQRKKPGMGAGGAAALGVGGGLIGGMVLANALDDDDQEAYQEGYEDGADGGDFDGGDF